MEKVAFPHETPQIPLWFMPWVGITGFPISLQTVPLLEHCQAQLYLGIPNSSGIPEPLLMQLRAASTCLVAHSNQGTV